MILADVIRRDRNKFLIGNVSDAGEEFCDLIGKINKIVKACNKIYEVIKYNDLSLIVDGINFHGTTFPKFLYSMKV